MFITNKVPQVNDDNLEWSFQQDKITLKARAIKRSNNKDLGEKASKIGEAVPRKTVCIVNGILQWNIKMHLAQTVCQNFSTLEHSYNCWIKVPLDAEQDNIVKRK